MPQPTNRQNYAVQNMAPLGSTAFVGTSSAGVLAPDPDRPGVIFANPGTGTIWLSPSNQPAVAGQGIPLLPGATLRFISDRLVSYTCGWNAIAASGSANPLAIIDLAPTAIALPPVPPVFGEFFIGINLTGPQNAAPVFPSAACINYYAAKLAGPNNLEVRFRTTLGWSQVQSFPPNATVGIQIAAFGALDTTSGYLNGNTNILASSQALASSPWGTLATGTGSVTSANNSGIAPDGTNSATLLTFNRSDTTSYAQVQQQFTTIAGSAAGFFSLKAATPADVGKQVSISLYNTDYQGLINVTLTSAWVQYDFTSITGAQYAVIGYFSSESPMTGAVNVLAWGAQVNAGATPLAYSATNIGYLGNLDQYVANVAASGAKCILDIHTFGVGPGALFVGSSGLPITAFADLWGKIAAHYVANPTLLAAIAGFDLMNEWQNGFSSVTAIAAENAAIAAIRTAGYTGPIYCEGVNFTGSWNWVSGEGQPYNNSLLYTLVDPLNNLIIEPHMYPDCDSSGSHFGYTVNAAIAGSAPPGINTNPTIGVTRLENEFIPWQQLHQLPAALGEFGSSNDSPWVGGNFDFADWNVITRNTISCCQENDLGFIIWEGGPGQPTGYNANGYAYSLDPFNLNSNSVADFTAAGVQHPAMVVLQEFTGYTGAQPTAYALFPPGIQTPNLFIGNGTPSEPLAVYYGGKIMTPQTITFHDYLADGVTPAGGTFTPASLTVQAGENFVGTVTYTASQVATILIATTNTAGWTDPAPIGVSSAPNQFVTAQNLSNIFALRRLYGPYLGPAVTLQRQQDNQKMSFAFNNLGNLPRQAIQNWANSRIIPIVAWCDQGPLHNNATLAGPAPSLTLNNSLGYPEITVTSGNQMATVAQANGKGLQTILARTNSVNNNIIVSQDIFIDMFRMQVGSYDVGPDSGTRYIVATGGVEGSWQETAASYSHLYTPNNLNGYLDGTLHASATAAQFTWSPSDPSGQTNLFYFRFGGDNWQGSAYKLIITFDELNAATIAALAASDDAYYSTPLPDSLSAVAPTIVGGGLPATTFAASNPFFGVSILDMNSGSPTDSLVITLSGASATLTGSGITGSNPYTIASAAPASVTATLQALTLSTSASPGSTINVQIAATSSAGTSASTTMPLTVATYVAETPFAAPGGTFTPVNMFGVNLSGGENGGLGAVGFPYPFEISYFAGKGFGLIRMPLTSQTLYTSAFGLLNTSIVNAMQTAIAAAYASNMYVVIDVHNGGAVWNSLTNAPALILPGTIGQALFNDLWVRIMTKWKNYPNVIFGLMNEPQGMSVTQWQTSVSQCITAARTASGTTQLITIPGATTFTAASSWVSSGNGAAWAGYNGDPANNFMFEMHQYLDAGDAGSTPVCVSGSGATILAAATAWLATNGFKAFLGEFGVGWDPWFPLTPGVNENYDPTHANTQVTGSVTENGNMLAYMKTNRAQWPAWAEFAGGINFPAAPQSGGYYFNPEPERNGTSGYIIPIVDQPQLAVLQAGL